MKTNDRQPQHPPFEDFVLDDALLERDRVRNSKKSNELRRLAYALSQGDSIAWEELYLLTGDSVSAFLQSILRSEEDALDITQEVYMNLWQNHEKINPEKNLRGYLYTLAKYYAFNFIKRKKIEEGFVQMSKHEIEDMDYNAEETFIADEVDLLIRMSLEMMPEQRSRIFKMSRYEGLSNEEIALRLNISRRTVESHIYNVTKQLKELLACAAILLLG